MTPFFIPFIFGRSGGSRRIGHVTPTPKPQEAEPAWKPTPEQMEALMLTIEGKAPAPTSYLSRRLEDLYEGLANTYGVECDLNNEADPEVDLEAEIDKYFEGFGCDGPDGKYAYLKIDTIKGMIRHFCGLNPKHK